MNAPDELRLGVANRILKLQLRAGEQDARTGGGRQVTWASSVITSARAVKGSEAGQAFAPVTATVLAHEALVACESAIGYGQRSNYPTSAELARARACFAQNEGQTCSGTCRRDDADVRRRCRLTRRDTSEVYAHLTQLKELRASGAVTRSGMRQNFVPIFSKNWDCHLINATRRPRQ